MPWDIILAASGSSSLTAVIIVVLGLTLVQKFMSGVLYISATEREADIQRQLLNQNWGDLIGCLVS